MKAAEAVDYVVVEAAATDSARRSAMSVVMPDLAVPRRRCGTAFLHVTLRCGTMPFHMVSRGRSLRASSASARSGESGSAEHQAGESHGHECFEFLVHSAPSLSVSF